MTTDLRYEPQSDRERPRRGSRTRFDRTSTIIIGVAVGAIVAIAIALVAFILISEGSANSRVTDVTPRNLDLWAIYPGGRVRFATLFHPGRQDPEGQVAGPLVLSLENITDRDAIGGEVGDAEVRPGPGEDSQYVYELLTILRDGESEFYGIDVMSRLPPYLVYNPSSPTRGSISLGISPTDAELYEQKIVAVAFPRGTQIVDVPELKFYRQARIGRWQVYYFDSKEAVEKFPGLSIKLDFASLTRDPEDVDILEVDARR